MVQNPMQLAVAATPVTKTNDLILFITFFIQFMHVYNFMNVGSEVSWILLLQELSPRLPKTV